jgi:PPP family 3-phenylpropionic acid transporter
MHRLLARFTLGSLLFTSLMLAALRWLMIGLCGANLAWLALAQVLHAASYASYHAASIAWVQRVFGDAHAGQGQALYSSLGYGAGWAVGAGLSGLYWSLWGAHSFFAAAAVAAGAALIAWRWLLHREP